MRMGYTIAVAGKGGTGKTTVAGLLVRLIKEAEAGSILAIDADPNSNLAEVLGVETGETIGAVIDSIAKNPSIVPSGMSKDRFIEYRIQTAIREAGGFDLLTMGRPEGPGCYCYANSVLRGVMDKLIRDYDFVVIDNEAGLEHLSRRTTRSADTMLVISDATVVGLKAARRIAGLINELEINTGRKYLLLNRCDEVPDNAKEVGLQPCGCVPADPEITAASVKGVSLWDISTDAVSLSILRKLGEKIWQSN